MVLDGAELEGEIGKIAKYKLDVAKDGTVKGGVEVAQDIEKEIIPGLKVFIKGGATAGVDADAVVILIALAAKNPESKVLKYLAKGAAAVRDLIADEKKALEAPKA